MSSVILPPASRRTTVSSGRRQAFRFVLFAIGAILLAAVCGKSPAGAVERGTLTIPLNDGYGFDDCLKTGAECGLVVADAWCKAHGFAGSEGFGRAEDAKPTPGSVNVICGGHVN